MNKEITNIEDIKHLVDSFYDKVRKDDMLVDIFNTVIKDRWPVAFEKDVSVLANCAA